MTSLASTHESRERRPESPEAARERERSVREQGDHLRQESRVAVDEAIGLIDNAWEMPGNEAGDQQKLGELRQEVVSAEAELKGAIATVETVEDLESDGEAAEAAGMKAAEMIWKQEGYLEDLEELAALAKNGDAERRAILRVLSERVGSHAAELLDSPEFRKDLAEMKERLGGKYGGEDGDPMATELSLGRLIAVRELMGGHPENFLAAIDIKKRLEGTEAGASASYASGEQLLRIEEPWYDPETGALMVEIKARMMVEVGDGFAIVSRKFTREIVRGPDGKPRAETAVEHELLEFPESLKAQGLAAEMTRDSLKQYDEMGIDAVKLHADIDMGGYAWAAYGYGWDKNEMAKKNAYKDQEKEVEIGGARKKMKDLSSEERDSFLAEKGDALSAEAVRGEVQGGRDRLEKALASSGIADAESVLKQFDELSKNELTMTPQTIADFGRKGPKLYLDTNGPETWYTAEGLAEAVEKGRINKEQAEDMKKKGYHAGKIVLRNSNWHGRIDLKKDGAQGGKNRQLLEQYLEKK